MNLRVSLLACVLFLPACQPTEGATGSASSKDDGGTDGADGTDGGGADGGGGDGTCVSDSYWTGGNSESPRMHPGMDCIACHTSEGEGPRFTVAGTVFTEYDEPDDCNGVEDVVVEVTDATGAVWTESTNSAGNFYFRDDEVVFPITAKVIDGDVERAMLGAVGTGACASCHSSSGASGAPGRVIAP